MNVELVFREKWLAQYFYKTFNKRKIYTYMKIIRHNFFVKMNIRYVYYVINYSCIITSYQMFLGSMTTNERNYIYR